MPLVQGYRVPQVGGNTLPKVGDTKNADDLDAQELFTDSQDIEWVGERIHMDLSQYGSLLVFFDGDYMIAVWASVRRVPMVDTRFECVWTGRD